MAREHTLPTERDRARERLRPGAGPADTFPCVSTGGATQADVKQPLDALARYTAELGRLDLFAKLDDLASGAIGDEARLDAVIARFRDGVRTSLRNPARVYGWHTQVMFGQVVRALGKVVLLTEDDQGTTWARPSEQICPGDYRAVLADGRNLAIEVKNHRAQGLEHPFKVPKVSLDGHVRYAALIGCAPRVAIFWSELGLWFLVDPARFSTQGRKATIDMCVAMAENEMADLGDMMIGTVPPLEFALEMHEVGDRRRTAPDKAEVEIQIDRTAISAGVGS